MARPPSWFEVPGRAVGGGPPAVEAGTLTVMAGGQEEDLQKLAPLMHDIAGRCTHMGPVGAGLAAKMTNRLICGVGTAMGLISFAPLVLLPASMDVLCMGMLLAVLVKNNAIDWDRWSLSLRIAPIACLIATFIAQRIDSGDSRRLCKLLSRRDRRRGAARAGREAADGLL